MYEYSQDYTCTMKVGVYLNRDGNILQPGETIAGQKTLTFSGFASSITAAETLNDDDSPALHNGIAGLMWLFTGSDDGNFDPLTIKKVSTEEIDYE